MSAPVTSESSSPVSQFEQDRLLEMVALNEHSWRVCDRRRDEGDAMRVLAFVERRRGSFRITWLAGGRGWAVFKDLPTAMKAIRVRCEDQGLD